MERVGDKENKGREREMERVGYKENNYKKKRAGEGRRQRE